LSSKKPIPVVKADEVQMGSHRREDLSFEDLALAHLRDGRLAIDIGLTPTKA